MKVSAEEMAMVKSMIMETMTEKGMAGKSMPEAAMGSAATSRRVDTGEHDTEQTN
jgi:hypothetical protein